MSRFKLTSSIKVLLGEDKRVITQTIGTEDEYDSEKQNIPVLSHLYLGDINFGENYTYYDVQLTITDAVVENNNLTVDKWLGNDNREEVFSNISNIIKHFIGKLRTRSKEDDIFAIGEPNATPVFDFETVNNLSGYELSISIGVPELNINLCETI